MTTEYLFNLLRTMWAAVLAGKAEPQATRVQMELTRRRFLQAMGIATAGGIVAHSFPAIIVPQNIVAVPHGLLLRQSPFDAAVLAAEQRKYIAGVIEALHRRESVFLKRLARTATPSRGHFRGKRMPLMLSNP